MGLRIGVLACVVVALCVGASAHAAYSAAVLVVTNTSSVINGKTTSPAALKKKPGGDGISLAEAVKAANAGPGPTTITFSPKLAGKTIPIPVVRLTRAGTTLGGLLGKDGLPSVALRAQYGIAIGASNVAVERIALRGVAFPITVSTQGGELDADSIVGNLIELSHDHAVSVDAANGGSIVGLTIADNTFRSLDADAIIVSTDGTGSVIQNLSITRNAMSEIQHVGIEINGGAGSTNGQIVGTTISGNAIHDVSLAGQDPAIYFGWFGQGTNAGNVIEHTLVSGNSVTGAHREGVALESGEKQDTSNAILDMQIVNNLIVSAGTGVSVCGCLSGNRVDGVTLVNDTIDSDPAVPLGVNLGVPNVHVTNSILWGPQANAPGLPLHYEMTASIAKWSATTSLAALFVDPAAGNFHLRAGSPAIDAGASSGAPGTDLDGHNRSDGRPDIGAYEFAD